MDLFSKDRLIENTVYILCKRRRMVLWSFLGVLFFSVFFSFLLTPTWEATTYLLPEANPRPDPLAFSDNAGPVPAVSGSLLSQNLMQLLTGKGLAREMVVEFGLDERKRIKKEQPEELRDQLKWLMVKTLTLPITLLQKIGIGRPKQHDWVDEAVDDFRDGLTAWLDTTVVEGTYVIELTIHGESQQLAADVANAMARRFTERVHALATQANLATYNAYVQQREVAADRLRAAQDQLRQFKETSKSVLLADESRYAVQRLDQWKGTVQSAVSEKKVLEEQLKAMAGDPAAIELTLGSDSVAKDPVIQALKSSVHAQQVKVSALLTERTEAHPDVVNAKAELDQFLQELERAVRNMVITLDGEIASYTSAIRKLEEELMTVPAKEIELARLEAEVEVQSEILKSIDSRAQELKVMADSGLGDVSVKILDEANVSSLAGPDFPNWAIVIIVGLILAVGSALVLPFLVEFWLDPVQSARDLEEASVPVLGCLPDTAGGRRRS